MIINNDKIVNVKQIFKNVKLYCSQMRLLQQSAAN